MEIRGEMTWDRVWDFTFAGKALFTLESPTGVHKTFRVKKVHDAKKYKYPIWLVYVLAGSNNTNWDDYAYVGLLKGNPQKPNTIKLVPAKRRNSRTYRAFDWFLARAGGGNFATSKGNFRVFHEGRCGKCGRVLTVPESISQGLGPICAQS